LESRFIAKCRTERRLFAKDVEMKKIKTGKEVGNGNNYEKKFRKISRNEVVKYGASDAADMTGSQSWLGFLIGFLHF